MDTRSCDAGVDLLLAACERLKNWCAEDCHMGSAPARIFAETSVRGFRACTSRGHCSATPKCLLSPAAHWNIAEHEALQAYAWTWAENQVLAAVKLVPLGQSAGQRMPALSGAATGASCYARARDRRSRHRPLRTRVRTRPARATKLSTRGCSNIRAQRGSRSEMPCMPALFLMDDEVRRRAAAMAFSGVPVAASSRRRRVTPRSDLSIAPAGRSKLGAP